MTNTVTDIFLFFSFLFFSFLFFSFLFFSFLFFLFMLLLFECVEALAILYHVCHSKVWGQQDFTNVFWRKKMLH